MILPGSYTLALILLVLTMLCWGSWANTFKMAGKWRFELYYFDFAIGVVVTALIAAFTFGSMGWDGFSFLDDLRNAGKREDLFAFMGGAVFNLGNMLLVAAISLTGMSVAFPMTIGVALVIGVLWSFILHPTGNAVFLGVGCALLVAAVLLNSMAYSALADFNKKKAQAAVKTKAAKSASSTVGIIVALAGGLFMGSFYPLVELANQTEVGLGPYATAFVFGIGLLATTFVYNLFFMNLPFQGQPVDFSEYFKGTGKQHLLGFLGGAIWTVGTIASFVAARAEGAGQVGPAISYPLTQSATLLAVVWGILYWKEFAGAPGRTRMLETVTLFLFVLGLTSVSVAPIFVNR